MQRQNDGSMSTLVWQSPPSCFGLNPPALSIQDIHVWGILLHADDETASTLLPCLSGDERERAARLISGDRRLEFIAARAALRGILARYTAQRPENLRFGRTEPGKPFLILDKTKDIRFNMSHSRGRALIAVSRGRDVGVDLEGARAHLNVLQLAERFLSSEESSRLRASDPDDRPVLFRRFWVVREAVAKAAGTGLRFPLHETHVALSATATEGYVVKGERPEPFLARLIPLEGEWIGAVAAAGSDWQVVLCR